MYFKIRKLREIIKAVCAESIVMQTSQGERLSAQTTKQVADSSSLRGMGVLRVP